MTINWEGFSQHKPTIRLTFGVPLEDVFPDGDIHPSMKHLLLKIHENCIFSSTSLCSLLRPKVATSDVADLEKALTHGSKLLDLMCAPTLMWILRHFLACLPLPLLPKYTDRQFFSWRHLSQLCKYSIERHCKDSRRDRFLIDKVSTDLLRLPRVNLLLIGYFVNFLRSLMLVTSNEGPPRISLRAARTLVNYFGGSLFVRTDNERSKKSLEYHPLMLFLLMKWPDIQQKCIQKEPHCFLPQKNGTVCNLYDVKTKKVAVLEEKGFQLGLGVIAEVNSSVENLNEDGSISSYYSLEESTIISDIKNDFACQALPPLETTNDNEKIIHAKNVEERSAQTDEIEARKSDKVLNFNEDLEQFNRKQTIEDEKLDFQTKCDVFMEQSRLLQTKSSRKSLHGLDNECADLKRSESSNKSAKSSNKSAISSKKSVISCELLEMNPKSVTKTGWTYDKDREFSRKCQQLSIRCLNSETSQLEDKNCIKDESLNANLNNELQSSVNLSDKLPSSVNLNNGYFEPSHCPVENVPLTREEVETQQMNKKVKKLSTFSKIKTRLEFIKAFRNKDIARSSSVEHVQSKVKYKKMCPIQSNTF